VAIPGIGQLVGAPGAVPLARPKQLEAGGEPKGDFGNIVVNALQGLEAVQDRADGLAVKAATGDLTDVHDYTIAATEAALATEFTVAVRNRAVEAFNEVMRMQI